MPPSLRLKLGMCMRITIQNQWTKLRISLHKGEVSLLQNPIQNNPRRQRRFNRILMMRHLSGRIRQCKRVPMMKLSRK
ncbi:hypothetical protein HPB52_022830 [Rhipicephalus sanguineus]|uniref:Uncharacterized protein n=1 Tax=Rhipicephalus sanguineus TaxID=34632 RepID=A0A9D4PV90_RHISA|nr:hypothetical protein HPB52_022830 [Rhipicephalus sanguineus]